VQAAGKTPRTSWDGSLNMLSEERALMQEALRQVRHRLTDEKNREKRLLEQKDEIIHLLQQEKGRLAAELDRLKRTAEAARIDEETRLEKETIERAEWDAERARRERQFERDLTLRDKEIERLEETMREDAVRHGAALARWGDQEKGWIVLLEKRDADIAALQSQMVSLGLDRRKDAAAAQEESRRLQSAQADALKKAEDARRQVQERLDTRAAENESLGHYLARAQEELVRQAARQREIEGALKAAEAQAGRLQTELQNVQEAWEVERAHWRELWERERSSRERYYDDMRRWEEELRAEREQWMSSLRAEEQHRLTLARRADKTLERFRQVVWSFPLFFDFRNRGRFLRPPAWLAGAWNTNPRVFSGAAAGGVLLLWTGFYLAAGPREYEVPAGRIAGLAVAGDRLWYAEWMNGQILQSSTRRPQTAGLAGAPAEAFHPVAINVLRQAQDERLWTLDTWSKSLQEHLAAPPFPILRRWALPLSAPVDFAWDGQGFWVLDKGDQSLSRFSLGSFPAAREAGAVGRFDAADRRARLPAGWNLTAVDFSDGKFWGYDEAARRLRRFDVRNDAVVPEAAYRLGAHEKPAAPLTGLRVAGRRLWTVSEKSRTVYRWSRARLAWRARLTFAGER